jgi:malate dehydrogenase
VIAAALADDHRRIHGQVMIEGECLGIHGVFGLPISLHRAGWIERPTDLQSISPLERAMIADSAKSIRDFLDEVTGTHAAASH